MDIIHFFLFLLVSAVCAGIASRVVPGIGRNGFLAGALVGLSQIIEEKLHQGYKVNLEGIGIFSLSVSSDMGYEDPTKVIPGRVKAKKVCYKGSQKLQKNLEFVKFERPRDK